MTDTPASPPSSETSASARAAGEDRGTGRREIPRRHVGRRATKAGLASLVLAVALIVGLLAGGVIGGSSGPGWSAAVAPIASQVSGLRGLSFDHTVPVSFLVPSRFATRIRQGDQPRTGAQRADERRYASEVRALGLVDGTVDLTGAQSASDSADTDGEYDERTQKILIRGHALGVGEKVTLVHELTHVLQDQHFGLARLSNQAASSGASAALTALEEGDAVRIEQSFLTGLPASEQKAYAASPQGRGGGSSGGAGNPPQIIEVMSSAPYVLGPDMVEAIAARGGNASVDAAFRAPPTAEINFLQPVTYLDHARFRPIPTPPLDPRSRQDGPPDDFGAFSLYITLASRIDPLTALAAADGWGGDRQVQFFRGTQSCVRADFVGQTAPDTTRIGTALQAWDAAMPPGQATVEATSTGVTLTACDPGTTATAGPRSLSAALDLADARDANLAAALAGGASNAVALCDGNGAIRDQTLLDAERAANSGISQPSASVTRTIQRESQQIDQACTASNRAA